MNSPRIGVWSGFIAISLIWGSTWLAIKIGLGSVPPFLGVGIRFLVGAAILFIIVRWRKVQIPWTHDTRILYVSLIILSYSIPFGLVYWAELFIPSGLGSILFASYPFWVAIFSQIFLPGERGTMFKAAGIVLGFSGLLIIFSNDIHWTDAQGLLGMSAVLLSTVMQAASTIVAKKYGQPVNPFAMNLVGMSFGGALLFLFGLMTESWSDIHWDAAAIGSIAYLAVFGSVIAFVTYHWLLKRVDTVYLSLTTFINPIVAVILGALILDEELAASVYLGAGMVLSGILVANGKYFYEKIAGTK
ncbi:MAG: DMT family transporter [Bacteroidota bacterium]